MTAKPTADIVSGDSSPLDVLLRQLAERAPSARARAWARRLLDDGERAAASTPTTPPQPLRPRCTARRGHRPATDGRAG